ncbi:hypothetical protein HanIR_Chr08g0389201 [Helianthus annuus]|nr:hypothetical protein HanIR_Chr08g0389201 [Helianthus annuus]
MVVEGMRRNQVVRVVFMEGIVWKLMTLQFFIFIFLLVPCSLFTPKKTKKNSIGYLAGSIYLSYSDPVSLD